MDAVDPVSSEKEYGRLKGPYDHKSVRKRIEQFFLDNLGKVVTREQLIEVARDPSTGKEPENWHQRLSELRTDAGYTILSRRDRKDLGTEEYLMPDATKRDNAAQRVKPTPATWASVLERASSRCEWFEAGEECNLKEGDTDPVGGGTVRLTPDHKSPHSINPHSDPDDPDQWQALCGRHQVVKKNYWDNTTGKINVYAVVQAAGEKEKREILAFLTDYFNPPPSKGTS
jgi:hypothetical protein